MPMFETLGNFVMAEHLWRMTFDPPEERLRMPSFQPAGRVGLTDAESVARNTQFRAGPAVSTC